MTLLKLVGKAGVITWLLVLGWSASSDVILTRFNADGSRDTSFGGAGSVHVGNSWSNPDVAIQPDGKIVLSAKVHDGAMLARFDTAGNLDAGFGTGGVTGTILTPLAEPKSLALQPDGKILVSANEHVAIGVDYPLVLRYDASGFLDPTFGTNGKATQTATTLSGTAAIDLALQPDGRILLAGTKSIPGAPGRFDFVLLRLQGDAALTAATPAPARSSETLSAADAPSLLGEVPRRRWQTAGADVSGPGHLLGLAHSDHDDDLMFESLAAGQRHVPRDAVDEALLTLAAGFEQAAARPKRRGSVL